MRYGVSRRITLSNINRIVAIEPSMLATMDPSHAEDSIVAAGRESRGSTTVGGLKRRMAKQLPRVFLVAKKVGSDHIVIGAMMVTECFSVEFMMIPIGQ